MPTTCIDYKPPRVETTRTYGVEGLAPDTETTEAGGKRAVTIRSRTLKLQTLGDADPSTTVTDVSLEGRQVRKSDGKLGNSRVFCWRYKGWRGVETPPAWILDLIEAEGLRYGE